MIAAHYLLFESGGMRLALPLSKVRGIREWAPAEGAAGLPEGVAGLDPGPIFRGQARTQVPERWAMLEERGLTLGLLIDRIAGIRDGRTVVRHPLPRRLAWCRALVEAILAAPDGLYLLVDAVALACGEGETGGAPVPGAAHTREATREGTPT